MRFLLHTKGKYTIKTRAMPLTFTEPEYKYVGLFVVNLLVKARRESTLPADFDNFAESTTLTVGEDLLELKGIIEGAYTDGITAIKNARFEGEDIVGTFEDTVADNLTKRYTFRISGEGETSYKLLNPGDVDNFIEPVDFATKGKAKNCSKGIPCKGQCISKNRTCIEPGSAATKRKVGDLKAKNGAGSTKEAATKTVSTGAAKATAATTPTATKATTVKTTATKPTSSNDTKKLEKLGYSKLEAGLIQNSVKKLSDKGIEGDLKKVLLQPKNHPDVKSGLTDRLEPMVKIASKSKLSEGDLKEIASYGRRGLGSDTPGGKLAKKALSEAWDKSDASGKATLASELGIKKTDKNPFKEAPAKATKKAEAEAETNSPKKAKAAKEEQPKNGEENTSFKKPKATISEVDDYGYRKVKIDGVPELYTHRVLNKETDEVVKHFTSPMKGTKEELGSAYELRSKPPIKSQKEFEKEIDEAYKRVSKHTKQDDMVEINKLRRALGDRLTRTDFDKYLKELIGSDKYSPTGGSFISGDGRSLSGRERVYDSYETPVSGLRTYLRRTS